jgi:NADPH-dependent glutamate synthase beta subunit-like oxidoreductase
MSLGEFDDSGRRRPVPIEGSEFEVKADVIITAIGQVPDSSFLDAQGLNVRKNGTIEVDKWDYSTGTEAFFAGGDVARGPDTVITAIADGKVTAGTIDEFLMGRNRLDEIMGEYSYGMTLPDNQEPMERVKAQMREPGTRATDFKEVCSCYDDNEYIAEANRCLRCDIREVDEVVADEGGGA